MAVLVHNASLSTSLTSTIQYAQFYCLAEESTEMNGTITTYTIYIETEHDLAFQIILQKEYYKMR